MHGKIMWNTRGFMETEVSKSISVNMAINQIFFLASIHADSPSAMTSDPRHIVDEFLEKKVRHTVKTAFTISGVPVTMDFDYDYRADVVTINTTVDDAKLVSHELMIKHLPDDQLHITSRVGHNETKVLLDRKFILNDPDTEPKPNDILERAGYAISSESYEVLAGLMADQEVSLDGQWIELPYEGRNLPIDWMISMVRDHFPELNTLGQATSVDWLFEEAESFPVLPEPMMSGMSFKIGQDSFFLSRVQEYVNKLTGDDVYIGDLNWMRNSINWWRLSQEVQRVIMIAQGNPDRITSMKYMVQRALDAYNESNSKGVGRAGMEANSGVILNLTEFILSYKPEK